MMDQHCGKASIAVFEFNEIRLYTFSDTADNHIVSMMSTLVYLLMDGCINLKFSVETKN